MSKRKKKFTVPEFKTWLDGIMQFQDDDWSPTREQWDEIYEKIMDLKEPVTKEKMSLNEAALDEINGIVYDNITEALNQLPRPAPMNANPHPNPNSPPGMGDPQSGMGDPNAMGNPNPLPPQPGDELANKSLSDLRREAEERHHTAGNHKLPDQTDGGVPEDFV